MAAFKIADRRQTPIWVMKIDSHGDAYHVGTIHPRKSTNPFRRGDRTMAKAKKKRKRSVGQARSARRRSVVHRLKNPKPVGLFRTKAAARKYAKEHARPGVKFSVKKIKRGE